VTTFFRFFLLLSALLELLYWLMLFVMAKLATEVNSPLAILTFKILKQSHGNQQSHWCHVAEMYNTELIQPL